MFTRITSSLLLRKVRIAAGLALGAALLAVPVAFAAWMSINTNDGLVAENLGTPLYTSTCNDGSLADYLEIKNAWVAADGGGFYFRLEACGTPAGGSETLTLRIGAGIDCNNDGDVADPYGSGPEGDRKIIYWVNADQVWLYSGANQQIIQMPDLTFGEKMGATYDWWIPIDKLPPACRASGTLNRLALATAKIVGGAPVTQDETPLDPFSHPIDYGDANNPDPMTNTCTLYPTRIGCDGARHGLNSDLALGALRDADGGNAQGPNADGDDTTILADEDGVAPTDGVNWTPGGQGSITAVVTGGSGYLNCWVDWNRDSDWADAGERVVADASAPLGASAHTFAVPGGQTFTNPLIARCRLAPGTGQAAAVTGAVEFGEVEDHSWVFGATGNRPAPPVLSAAVNGTNVRLSWSTIAGNESYIVLKSARPYFAAGDGDVTSASDSASPYDDANKVGPPAEALFYTVQGQVTSSTPDLVSAMSNRVGLFEFSLTPGGP